MIGLGDLTEPVRPGSRDVDFGSGQEGQESRPGPVS